VTADTAVDYVELAVLGAVVVAGNSVVAAPVVELAGSFVVALVVVAVPVDALPVHRPKTP